ncbi:hypothetical protein CJJ23_04220 [Mycoplasmopsis agassizii]|uniref:Uncharacterized protein n=1 Tax=Mycoplasmopsis agassizii TaxID=33922 RepID=A0A269THR7_9BACT|nr:hypothetical protein [Mycoplasmopsis agassizii]PAK20984.1 hypothetical protein CJJ23_04220 [Mycoplasmopsis agassizii]
MSHLHIQKFNKKDRFRKIIIFSGLFVAPIFTSLAIACSSSVTLTEEDRRFAKTGKGTDVSVKTLENNKSIIQLKHVGYEYFTFSDYWWSEDKSDIIKNIRSNWLLQHDINFETDVLSDGEEENNLEADNHEVFFKLASLDELKNKISKSTVLKNSLKQEDQNQSDKQFKSVSLITDETSLRTQLRSTDEEKEKFSKFIKEKVDANLNNEDIENMMPWNSYFNYDLINQKLDLEKNNYLFIKDLTEFVDFPNEPSEEQLIYHKIDKGIQIQDYRIDIPNKTIFLEFSWFKVPYEKGYVTLISKPFLFKTPKTITSFLLPVDKDEISDFDFNEWKIVRDTSS